MTETKTDTQDQNKIDNIRSSEGVSMMKRRTYKIPIELLSVHPRNETMYEHCSVEDLVQSIKETGEVNVPLVINKHGQVLSGKRRLYAARSAGNITHIECRVSEVDESDLDALDLEILVHNNHRTKTMRDVYNEAQIYKRALAAKRNLPKGKKSTEYIAQRVGLTTRTYERLEYVMTHGPKTIVAAVMNNELTLGNAEAQIKALKSAPNEEQAKRAEQMLEKGEAKTAQEAVSKTRRETQKFVDPPKFVPAIEDSEKFSTIIIRPPVDLSAYGHPEKVPMPWFSQNYKPMSVEDICSLQVNNRHISDLATDDAHIYLIMPPKAALLCGVEILQAYGFELGTQMVWCRPNRHYGETFQESTISIIFGHRGEFERNDAMTLQPNHFTAVVPNDVMAMPETFYEIVRLCSPGPYLEIFTTSPKDGITCHQMKSHARKGMK